MAKQIRLGQVGKVLDEILENATKEQQKAADRALRATYIDRLTAVVNSTPVDTGALRNSWFLDMRPAYSKLGTSSSDTLDVADRVKEGKALGKTWYFYNNQPYAGRIEYEGHSDQASRGMLRVNIVSFSRKLKQNWKKEIGKL